MAKPEKRKKVQSFLEDKLRFRANPGGKHESYSIPDELAIYLPNQLPVNLQHGRKDVAPHIIRQIYLFLGLDYKEFLVGKDCYICASVIYRALLWKHLREYLSGYSGNRTAMGAVLDQYLISSEASLDVVLSDFPIGALNKHEVKLVHRISDQATELKSSMPDFQEQFDGRLAAFVDRIVSSFA